MELIDKDAIVAEIINRVKKIAAIDVGDSKELEAIYGAKCHALNSILSFIDTLEVKEINTWHLQKNEDIYDSLKDWSLHTFICLMDDGTIQKFTGICCECADGSINKHIDAIDDTIDAKYDVNDIIFWIEAPSDKIEAE